MIEYNYIGRLFQFKTDKKLFSPKGIDKGTEQMLNVVTFQHNDKLLDLSF